MLKLRARRAVCYNCRGDGMKRVIGLAQPRFMEGSGNEGVLLLHGLSSYPGVLDNIAHALHDQGYWVSVPRLPGHGTDGDDYVRSNARDWVRRAADAMFELAGRCEKVHLLGFSLGGVIALILAGSHDVASLTLLAPAVTNTDRLIVLTPLFRHLIKRIPNSVDFEGQDPDNPEIRYLAEEYWKWKWVGPAAELFKLQRRAKNAAGKIRAKTMLIVSKSDSAVPVAVKPILEKLLGPRLTRVVVLEESAHTLTTDCEKERVVTEIKAWFGAAISR